MFVSGAGFCQSAKVEKPNDENILFAQKENEKYNITANFYGMLFRPDENKDEHYKIIKRVVFQDNKSKVEIEYKPTGTIPAGNFYFTNVWSPDGNYLVMPIGRFEGIAIFEAKTDLVDLKNNIYFDTIKIKSQTGDYYAHDFETWIDDSTFSFRAGLSGNSWTFRYNISKRELQCFSVKCEELDIGENNKGEIKTIKKGDVKPLKVH
jgi:hypothetical protein